MIHHMCVITKSRFYLIFPFYKGLLDYTNDGLYIVSFTLHLKTLLSAGKKKERKKKKISGSTSEIAVFRQLVKLISLYEVLGYLRWKMAYYLCYNNA